MKYKNLTVRELKRAIKVHDDLDIVIAKIASKTIYSKIKTLVRKQKNSAKIRNSAVVSNGNKILLDIDEKINRQIIPSNIKNRSLWIQSTIRRFDISVNKLFLDSDLVLEAEIIKSKPCNNTLVPLTNVELDDDNKDEIVILPQKPTEVIMHLPNNNIVRLEDNARSKTRRGEILLRRFRKRPLKG